MPRRAGEACSFMAGLRHPLKPGPGQLRAAILASNPEITEHVKWNAPSLRPALPCEQLTTGRLMMIDRSAVATARTARRNATHQAAGRIAVRQTTLAALAAPAQTFDKALAINVNLFWVSDPAAELTVLKHALRPGAPTAHPVWRRRAHRRRPDHPGDHHGPWLNTASPASPASPQPPGPPSPAGYPQLQYTGDVTGICRSFGGHGVLDNVDLAAGRARPSRSPAWRSGGCGAVSVLSRGHAGRWHWR